MHGTVFNIQRFSLFDGPGARTVVFLKGCPLHCLWCHNPEGIDPTCQIMFDSLKCIGCGQCVNSCHNACHHIIDGMHAYDRGDCSACGQCVQACYAGALSVAGRVMDAQDVIQIVMRDLPLYKESGGGLTVSGGEPLYQADFTVELLQLAKERGISTCIETSGYGSRKKLGNMAAFTDVFYYDYKATGDAQHISLCGVSQKIILDNLKFLDSLGSHVVLRCPIIPGFNDTPENLAGIGETAASLKSVREVQLLPYHKMGKAKSEKLGTAMDCDTNVPSRESMNFYCKKIYDLCGKQTVVG